MKLDNLSDLSMIKTGQQVYQLKEKIKDLEKLREALKGLERIEGLLVECDSLKRLALVKYEFVNPKDEVKTVTSPLKNQKRQYLEFLESYPLLALKKCFLTGSYEAVACRYTSPKDKDEYFGKQEKDLRENGLGYGLDELLETLLKEPEIKQENKVETKPAEISV